LHEGRFVLLGNNNSNNNKHSNKTWSPTFGCMQA